MFHKIEEIEPFLGQYILFTSGTERFLGTYLGDHKASPLSETGSTKLPVFVISEWLSFKIWP